MPSSYSTSLRLELIGVGESGVSGNWGTTTNTNLGTLLEEAIAGVSNGVTGIVMADADIVLSAINGGSDQSRNMIINLTGSNAAQRNVTCPAVQKLYFVRNATGATINFKTPSGTGVLVPTGRIRAVYCDGVNVNDLITDLPSDARINGAEIVSSAGTQTLTNKTLTTPRIGTAILDVNGNESIRFVATASAVNEIQVTNAASGGTPVIAAVGDNTDVGLNLVSKGASSVFINSIPAVTTTGLQTLTNKTLSSPVISTISNTGTITLPTATTTLVGRDTTDTLTNKTLTSPTINSPTIVTPSMTTITNGGTVTIPSGTLTLLGDNSFANQATMETGTSTTTIVSPGNQKFHPSAAKAWILWNAAGTPTINANFNVSSITDNGVGDQTINFTTAFSSVNYNASQQASNTSPDTGWYLVHQYNTAGRAAGSFRAYLVAGNFGSSSAGDYPINNIAFFGDQ